MKKELTFEQYLINNNIKYIKLEEEGDIAVDEIEILPYELDIKKHFPHYLTKQEHNRYNTIPHNREFETEGCLD